VPDLWRGYDYRRLAGNITAAPSLRHVLVLGEPAANQISLTDLADVGRDDPDRIGDF
jgi:hypothetical protein